ncbi:hypothetical protein [Budvicia aquatica]|uniref:Uncharacterized protein n=1 Tax=Budvicia aquatica TaxID=82979 RepID=A0A2C6DKP2_9GAMM|nr:hypothetical protein [Budvicia aquatica]PHI30878.1 hypothetical protein CRN84_16810 [Budvicia aquatica]VFS50745.1 Uncharacterised protein [Budvicia aquatica]
MKVTCLDMVVSIVTLLAIAVMVPMPWLSSSRDAEGYGQRLGPLHCAPVATVSELRPASITALWLASFPAPVKPARDCSILVPSAHPAVSQHQEPVLWHQMRYDDE